MTELEKATAIIAAASGVAETEVAELLTSDDAVKSLTGSFETKFTELRDQGNKTATKKTRTAVEAAFKAAGVEDASFEALPAAIEAIQAKAAAANPAALTEEQALKLPAVVKELNKLRSGTETAVEAARTEERTKLADERKQFDQKRTAEATRAEVKALLKTLNPNYTAGKEAAQESRLIDEIMREGRFQLDDSGRPQLTDEEGNLLPGKLGNGVAQVADFVRDRADEAYGLPTAQPRDSAGLTQAEIDAGKGAGAYTGPKTKEELDQAIIKSMGDPTQAAKLQASFAANVKTE